MRYTAGVGTGLNENREAKKRPEYFVRVLKVLEQGEMGKMSSGSS